MTEFPLRLKDWLSQKANFTQFTNLEQIWNLA